MPSLEVVVPGGELPSGLALVLDGVPRFTPGAIYILALNARGDGTYVPTELGLGAFDIVRDEAGRDYATRSMFRGEKVAVLERETDGSLVERREPLRELAAFASYVGAELFREAPVPGPPAYVVISGAGELRQVRQGGVSALWDDHWCPNGIPGTCGDSFIRYRWVNPVATVRYCDENPSTPGQSGAPGGGLIELERAVGMWVSDPNSEINYTYGGAVTGTCSPGSVPAAGTIPIYFDNLSMFGGKGLSCPLTVDGLLAIGGNVIDQSTHAFKGTTYKTIRGGIGWVRAAGPNFCGEYTPNGFQAVMAHILGSTLGLSAADRTRNPNDLNPNDDRYALMVSTYGRSMPFPVLGTDDRDAICYLYGPCEGLVEARLFVPFVGSVAGQGGSRFTSDMALTNRSDVDSEVTINYKPALGTGEGTVGELVPAGRQILISNVIDYLRAKGLAIPTTGDVGGTLRIVFKNVYTYDATVTVRTRTDVPPTVNPIVGRAGLAYLGVNEERLMLDPAWLLGLRQSELDRSNIAFQHAGVEGDANIRLRATWYSSTGVAGLTPVERTLSPGGWTQFELPVLEPGATEGYIKVEMIDGRSPWYAYGVVNDRKNSDGSFIAPIADETLQTQERVILPVAVEAGPYATEIILNNTTDTDKVMRLKWVADGLQFLSTTIDYTVKAGHQFVIPDWVEELRKAGSYGVPAKGTRLAGAIFLSVPNGSLAGVSISARVLNPATDKAAKATDWGLYGVHYPAQREICFTNQASWLGGLRQDDIDRTNVAIINTGEVDATVSSYLVEIFDGDTGKKAGETIVQNLPYERFIQLDRVIFTVTPLVKNAFIKVTAIDGENPFITYAVLNDGSEPGKRSGDGAYIPSEIVSSD
jgi:hypothetical protein